MSAFNATGAPSLRTALVAQPLAGPAGGPGMGAERSRIEQLKSTRPKPGEASFFYRDHHFKQDSVKVLPGEYYVTQDDMMIMTVLGSCIAACIWDPKVRVGGMNHFMLPDGGGDTSGRYGSYAMELLINEMIMLPDGGGDTSGRYGSYAMELLINEMIKLGARREWMQAKVFGGGQVMHSFTTMNVGERNTEFVIDYLQTERIAVVSKDVLDIYPRKVCYFPATGKAMIKRLAHSHPETLETQERKGSAASMAKTNAGGSVDLF